MTTYNPDTGSATESKEHFVIETDGVALFKVFSVEGVDATRTTSNNVMEIFQIRELRFILGTYDIYVNYRHLGTLVDVMT
jgi:DNA-directed RNA polymerase II subunit RPB1